MTELNVIVDFACGVCGNELNVELKCIGKGLAAAPDTVAAVHDSMSRLPKHQPGLFRAKRRGSGGVCSSARIPALAAVAQLSGNSIE